MAIKSSDHLTAENIYTRKELAELFDIKDANLKNGVFRPKNHDSIWLFVTEEKSLDRTQYHDFLDGDTLNWDGQLRGRTDRWIIEHRENSKALLLFYRHDRSEHPGAGFRYEGEFEYISHQGEYPAHFILQRKLAAN